MLNYQRVHDALGAGFWDGRLPESFCGQENSRVLWTSAFSQAFGGRCGHLLMFEASSRRARTPGQNSEMKKIASIPELVLGKLQDPPYIWGYELQFPVDFLSNQSIQSNTKTWALNHSDQFLQASAFKCGIQRFSRADGKYFLLPFCLQKHCCRQVVIDGQYLLYNWIVKVWLLTFHRKLWKRVAITAQEKWHRSLRQTTIAFHFPTTMNSRNNLFWDVVMSWDFNSSKSILPLNHRFLFVACVFLQPPGCILTIRSWPPLMGAPGWSWQCLLSAAPAAHLETTRSRCLRPPVDRWIGSWVIGIMIGWWNDILI